MDKSHEQKSAAAFLYPPIEPYERRVLDVGQGHSVYIEESGNPAGVPVVVLHGGPGGGSSPMMRRFFDPAHYRIVLFDQRGCGRSRPHASVEANTTQHLIADIEVIRQALGIGRWIVFGGSWGATLALAYAQAHPSRAAWLVLRGVFTGTQAELDWFYGGGAGRFYPELWSRFVDAIPVDERDNLIGAYHKRLFSGVFAQESRFARLWSDWENALATVETRGFFETPVDYARAFARLENHYFTNACFFERDGQLLADLWRMSGVRGTIVQGQLDMICPPVTAWGLHRKWTGSTLRMVPMAGHALSEPGITSELVSVMDGLKSAGLLRD
ncbi:prolyl aminopeptidase [Pararhodobacter zhoushanensis]|uniref:Proline iminopeptidase n=1 Tax=Pararhodobacter zhoushanensis TaxID=2479545 RepID=A0ABT3GUY1_9RHOB|nr:prolyl aminopeptidase [Pararhodobacter zhoushanensis]MCW1931353.1 prolyl aminopeptidase [Pararhodobacter zhoushanensis]